MKVREFMRKDLSSVETDTPISEVIYIMEHTELSSLPVVDDKARLAGVISERDLIRAALPSYFDMLQSTSVLPNIDQLAKALERMADHPASSYMTEAPVTVHPEDEDLQVAELFIRKRLKQIPVVDAAGHLVGIVRRIDLLDRLSQRGVRRT